MTGLTVAVDAGTTLIKAVVLTDTGSEVSIATSPTAVLHPTAERSEQDMDEVRAAVLSCIARAVADLDDVIERVAITAQGDGAWFVDASGNARGPAVLWNDGRATDVIARWTQQGALDRAFSINGSLGNLGLPHALLAWFHDHEPARLDGVSSVLTCGGWLYLALTGVLGLHPSDASAPWLNVQTGEISTELLAIADLGWARALVPPVLRSDQCTAPLRADVADKTGLRAGIPVTIAPYDVVATAVGSGATTPGDAFCILGTTLCTGVLQNRADTSGTPSGLTLLNGDGSPVVRAFPTLAGTGVVDWAVTLLGLEGPRALTDLAAQAPPGAHGVRVWPYLSPAGERAPFLDPAARGVIGGVTLATDRADIARAVIEGLGHVIRDCLEATGTTSTSLALSGGGAGSALWCAAIADITGVPTTRGDRSQVGTRGALIAALTADGDTNAAQHVQDHVARVTIEPTKANRALADDRHADFLATRDALSTRWGLWRDAS